MLNIAPGSKQGSRSYKLSLSTLLELTSSQLSPSLLLYLYWGDLARTNCNATTTGAQGSILQHCITPFAQSYGNNPHIGMPPRKSTESVIGIVSRVILKILES